MAPQHHHLARRERLTLAAATLRGVLAGAKRAVPNCFLGRLTDN
ncbi:hypothetical protein [Pseudonocardia charpentierae]|uniref:Uncharacterized protein n=1 Tax=Pseudonocardia charpentierae TaxID=3075545 RepID=A0ABU2NLW2_9PSEU|nr:hypothetical protein [Pseudonocardia sp. DSM 45834]MDT0353619.1 hypothetical protein [Pseudonocardia sp. DSM 45834]